MLRASLCARSTNALRAIRCAAEFERFAAAGGEPLRRFALFAAIAAEHPRVPWQAWPHALREPDARGNARLRATGTRAAIRFALYLQWLADRQFDAAATRGAGERPRFGFFRDLAVGAAPDGAEVWANPSAFARGVAIGAPPDPFSTGGQNWNLPPPNPEALRASGSAAFGELLAANMRHAGALRIDHVMGLTRLFWIPDGAAAADGAYVRYPLELLLRRARGGKRSRALPRRRRRPGHGAGRPARAALPRADVLSYRVLWFEREGSSLRRAGALSGQGRGGGVDARPSDDRRMVERRRHRRESVARPRRCADAATAAKAERADAKARARRCDRRGGHVRHGAALSPETPHDATITAAIHQLRGRGRFGAGACCKRTTSPARHARSTCRAPTANAPTGAGRCASASMGCGRRRPPRLAISGFSAADGPAGRVISESRE